MTTDRIDIFGSSVSFLRMAMVGALATVAVSGGRLGAQTGPVQFPCPGSAYACSDPDATRVAVLVDEPFFGPLQLEIDRLAADIEADLGACVVIACMDGATVTNTAIRSFIKALAQDPGLYGSILVGDLPTSYWEYEGSYFATDRYYQDLDDAVWVDPDGNGRFNSATDEDGDGVYDWLNKSWIGEHNAEVWSGRLLPPRSADFSVRISLLADYLDRDHAYRTGTMTYQRGLAYAESVAHNGDPADGEDDSATVLARAEAVVDESWLLDRDAGDVLDFVWSEDLTAHMAGWLTAAGRDLEWAFVNVHGAAAAQWFGESNWLYSGDYLAEPPSAMVLDLASCNNGNFEHEDYLAGWALFAGSALAVFANTSPVFYVGDVEPNPDHRLLSHGLVLGDLVFGYVVSTDSAVLFGDPTLSLREAQPGPVLVHTPDHAVLRTEAYEPGGYPPEHAFTLHNTSAEEVTVYHRITSLTSCDGRRRWNDQSSIWFDQFLFPMVISPGEQVELDAQLSNAGCGPGTYRAWVLLYTDSPSTPFFWTQIEKTVRADLLFADGFESGGPGAWSAFQ